VRHRRTVNRSRTTSRPVRTAIARSARPGRGPRLRLRARPATRRAGHQADLSCVFTWPSRVKCVEVWAEAEPAGIRGLGIGGAVSDPKVTRSNRKLIRPRGQHAHRRGSRAGGPEVRDARRRSRAHALSALPPCLPRLLLFAAAVWRIRRSPMTFPNRKCPPRRAKPSAPRLLFASASRSPVTDVDPVGLSCLACSVFTVSCSIIVACCTC